MSSKSIKNIELVEVTEEELVILERQLKQGSHTHTYSLLLFSFSIFVAAIATGKVNIGF